MERMIVDNELTIQEVSERLELPKSTLRYWEKEFDGFIAPMRTSGGQRRYTKQDLDIILSICKLKQSGLSLVRVKEHLLNKYQHHDKLSAIDIDQLAKRIAVTVQREVYNFFEQSYPACNLPGQTINNDERNRDNEKC